MRSNYQTWLGVALFAQAGALIIGIILSRQSTLFVLLPIGLYVALAAALFGLAVLSGQRWAVGLLLVVAFVVFAVNLRGDVANVERQHFDLVSAGKLLIYCMVLLSGLTAVQGNYRKMFAMPGILLVGYAGLAFLTFPFSITPLYSLGMVFTLASCLLFANAVTDRFHTSELLILVIAGGTAYCIGSLTAYFVFPAYGRFVTPQINLLRLKGLSPVPNEAGQMAAITLISVLCFFLHGFHRGGLGVRLRPWLVLACVPAAAVLVMADSRGAMGWILVVSAALVLQRWRLGNLAFRMGILLILIGAVLYFAIPRVDRVIGNNLSDIARSGTGASEVLSLAGRTYIWTFVLDHIAQRPATGFGLGAGSRLIMNDYSTRWGTQTGSAHNALLQSTLDVGLIGAAMLAGIFLWSIRQYLTRPSFFRDGIGLFVLLTCLLESGISRPTSPLTLVWLVALLSSNPDDETETEGIGAAVSSR